MGARSVATPNLVLLIYTQVGTCPSTLHVICSSILWAYECGRGGTPLLCMVSLSTLARAKESCPGSGDVHCLALRNSRKSKVRFIHSLRISTLCKRNRSQTLYHVNSSNMYSACDRRGPGGLLCCCCPRPRGPGRRATGSRCLPQVGYTFLIPCIVEAIGVLMTHSLRQWLTLHQVPCRREYARIYPPPSPFHSLGRNIRRSRFYKESKVQIFYQSCSPSGSAFFVYPLWNDLLKWSHKDHLTSAGKGNMFFSCQDFSLDTESLHFVIRQAQHSSCIRSNKKDVITFYAMCKKNGC